MITQGENQSVEQVIAAVLGSEYASQRIPIEEAMSEIKAAEARKFDAREALEHLFGINENLRV